MLSNKKHLSRLLNLTLRGLTLVSKFAVIIFMARVLEPESVGLYGLLLVTISYGLYLLGFDFYTYSTRDLVNHPRSQWGRLFKSQLAMFGLNYLIVLPLSLLLFLFDFLPKSLAIWFLLLMVLEHLNQEVTRLMVIMSEQLFASIALFIRSGLWCLFAIAWMIIDPRAQYLENFLLCWLVGGLLSLSLAFWKISSIKVGGWRESIDWAWLRRGLTIAIPLLASTLAIRGVFTLDRYLFEKFVSLEVLGAYTLFMGLCAALMAFLDAGVFMYSYPKLIKLYKNSKTSEFSREMRSLFLLTLGFCFVFIIGSAVFLPYLLKWLGKDLYLQHQSLFWVLLIAVVLQAISMIPHYGLYAKGRDKPLILSHVVGLVVFVLSVYSIALYSYYWAVPGALLVTFMVVFMIKSITYQSRGSLSKNSHS